MKTEDNMTQELSNKGFAPATLPTAATTITTDSADILSGETSIPTQGENMPAFHAKPRHADGLLPVVLVIQEILAFMSISGMSAVVWRLRVTWPLPLNSISVRAIPLITPIYLPYSASW